jgi:RNA polymerase sigma-70 factor (ECF subfamily)
MSQTWPLNRPETMTREDFDTAWRANRRRLLDLAYRMTGTMSDAEDVVQEAYARLLRADVDAIEDLRGWLITVTSRLCLDQLRSARVTRAAYVGPWLPEPLVDLPDAASDPADRVTLDDSVRMALMVVLEQLSPAERVAFVLHDVFTYPYAEIGRITGRSISACRQLASRARRRIALHDGVVAPGDPAVHQLVVRRFAHACRAGDLGGLVEVLASDAVGEFDSGGTIPGAPAEPVIGAEPIARTLLQVFEGSGATFSGVWVNAEPGIGIWLGEQIVAVLSFEVAGDRVQHIHAVGNPEKLRRLA